MASNEKEPVSEKAAKQTGRFKYLSSEDFENYLKLKEKFQEEVTNAKRGEKVDVFSRRLDLIRNYVQKGNDDDWKRSFACGIFFFENNIAISIKQLMLLLGKCKSSINGSLHQLGYIARPTSKETDENLVNNIPIFQKDRSELKKWTIRQKKPSRKRNTHKAKEEECVEEEPQEDVQESPVELVKSSIEPAFTTTADDIWKATTNTFPIPIKFRYKMFSTYYSPTTL